MKGLINNVTLSKEHSKPDWSVFKWLQGNLQTYMILGHPQGV